MKNKGLIITLITIFALLAISLIILLVGLLNKNIKIPNINFISKVSSELILDENYENTFQKIKIESSASDIYFKVSNDNNVRVVIYGDRDKLEVKNKTEELYVKFEESKCIGLCFNTTKNKIEVYIPTDYDKKIIIDNNYGDINIDKFLKANIDINEDAGDVSVLGGNKIKAKNAYGDIKIEEASKIDIEEEAGDVEVGKVNDIVVQNNYGDIHIKNVLNYLNVSDDCGDIKIDNISLNNNSTISNDYGDIKIGTTNKIYIDAKTDLGDVDINNNFNKSDITLKIKNDCGDIKVNN